MSSPVHYETIVAQHGQTEVKHENCRCPACVGLECMERPRYFAGQLLTEAELNSEQAYVLAKNRLHNRYLHGWGVVCGLEVVCHDCEGFVTVKQGYAIDPCGNDIIVCADRDFNLIKRIHECLDSRRRKADCAPWRASSTEDCKDVEQHWCITVSYEEDEARPMTTLRQPQGSGCGCGCGSNGNGKKCGCGCHKSSTKSAKQTSARAQSGVGLSVAPCEPTRTFENYRLDVTELPADCRHTRLGAADDCTRGIYEYLLRQRNLSPLLALLRIAPDSLLVKIICCLFSLFNFLSKRVSQDDWEILSTIFFRCLREDFSGSLSHRMHGKAAEPESGAARAGEAAEAESDVRGFGEDDVFAYQQSQPQQNLQGMYTACCHLRQAVTDLYEQNPFNVRCGGINCQPCPSPTTQPGTNFNSQQFLQDLEESACCLFRALFNYAADCICMALLPPCAADPKEDRVILACVTVKNDKIVEICNFSCRRYAGSFSAVNYWLSLVPVIPFLAFAVERLCCAPDVLKLITNIRRHSIFKTMSSRFEKAMPNLSARMKSSTPSFESTFSKIVGAFAAGAREKDAGSETAEIDALRAEMEALRREVERLKKQ